MEPIPIDEKKYAEDLIDHEENNGDRFKTRKLALEHALDIRKFEIDLYWKRATYFWTFIAAAFAGFALVYTSDTYTSDTNQSRLIAFTIACLGFIFSFSWVLANKGSKQWQENWESHVDYLEDHVFGPLYKTVLKSAPEKRDTDRYKAFKNKRKPFDRLLEAGNYSVTKINLLISYFITLI
ncbi:MAG: hypothetical protein KAU50_02710 [Candidatus Marinimicrobia bacterium]|nr:hypothetical protein [Candidatus Neomarinimicrobiota bacterium]